MSAISAPTTVTSSREPTTGGWVRRNPLLTLYALMFALAWLVLVPQALASRGLLSWRVPAALSLIAGWSPAIAAVIVAGLAEGRAAVRDLLRRILILRVGLVTALREHVVQTAGAAGVQVTLEAPEPLPPLPAAVEVAAYRIVLPSPTSSC